MKIQTNETICAVSSAPGTGAIGIIRISGKNAKGMLREVFHPMKLNNFTRGMMTYGRIVKSGAEIDRGMAVFFKAPYTYTGEDMAEIYCHGSVFIQQEIIRALLNAGCALAAPGAFTLKAFANGKMDLLQAEGVNDLIYAHSEASSKMALRQMRGDYSKRLAEMRHQLIRLTALFELEIDFAEEDVEFASREDLITNCETLVCQADEIVKSFAAGNVIKHGIPVIIAGKPNVGKSTLLNILLNDDKAIVSEIPGTTRDILEDVVSIGGHSFRFIDTAGLRPTSDAIESIGIEKAKQKMADASVVLYMIDSSSFSIPELNNELESLKSEISDFEQKHVILVFNKMDIMETAPVGLKEIFQYELVFISAKRRENIQLILDHLLQHVENNGVNNDLVLTNVRHYEAFSQVSHSLKAAIEGIKQGLPNDIVASELRNAIGYLGKVTGEVDVEDILSYVFGNFCIGK